MTLTHKLFSYLYLKVSTKNIFKKHGGPTFSALTVLQYLCVVRHSGGRAGGVRPARAPLNASSSSAVRLVPLTARLAITRAAAAPAAISRRLLLVRAGARAAPSLLLPHGEAEGDTGARYYRAWNKAQALVYVVFCFS